MIFLCFNIKDRYAVAEPIFQHLRSFGYFVWYDRKDIFIGDNRYKKNILEGAGNPKAKYAVVIITPNFSSGNFCKEELAILKKRQNMGEITIFPLFYNIKINEIPSNYRWLLDFVCKFISSEDEKIYACYHIVSKLTTDILNNKKYNSLTEFRKKTDNTLLYDYIETYENINKYNYNARMAFLYSVYLHIKHENSISKLDSYYYRGIEKLFSLTKLNIKADKRELQIMENTLLLLLSTYY